jgi:hypothetical protein
MITGAGTLRVGRSFTFRMWLAFAVIVIAASVALALVIARPSTPAVQPASGGARVGATFEPQASTNAKAKGLPPQLLKVDKQLGG